jgi:hypothetical protein
MSVLQLFSNGGASVDFLSSDMIHFAGYLFSISALLLSFFLMKTAASRLRYLLNLKKLVTDKLLVKKLHQDSTGAVNSNSINKDVLVNLLYALLYLLSSVLVLVFSGWLLSRI